MSYVVIDIETTGLSRYYHRITELAAAKIENNEVIDKFHSMVNPRQRIPDFITRLTGINNEMVKDAPLINEIMPEFLRFLGKKIFVAHNVGFDYNFIAHNAEKHHDITIHNKQLCTRKLANRILPDLQSKRLQSLCERFNITNQQQHRAMGDVEATVGILNKMISLLPEPMQTPEEILKLVNTPKNKALKILACPELYSSTHTL